MHSEICPICLGKGKISCECGSGTKICHGCGGKGWVEVSDSYWYPYIYPYTDTQPYWETTGTGNNNGNIIISFEFSKKKK